LARRRTKRRSLTRRAFAFAIGQDIEAVPDHRLEELRTPATAVEDDGGAPLAEQGAHFAQQIGKGGGQRRLWPELPVSYLTATPDRR